MTDEEEFQSTWSTTKGGIDIPVSATARGAELRRELLPNGVVCITLIEIPWRPMPDNWRDLARLVTLEPEPKVIEHEPDESEK